MTWHHPTPLLLGAPLVGEAEVVDVLVPLAGAGAEALADVAVRALGVLGLDVAPVRVRRRPRRVASGGPAFWHNEKKIAPGPEQNSLTHTCAEVGTEHSPV